MSKWHVGVSHTKFTALPCASLLCHVFSLFWIACPLVHSGDIELTGTQTKGFPWLTAFVVLELAPNKTKCVKAYCPYWHSDVRSLTKKTAARGRRRINTSTPSYEPSARVNMRMPTLTSCTNLNQCKQIYSPWAAKRSRVRSDHTQSPKNIPINRITEKLELHLWLLVNQKTSADIRQLGMLHGWKQKRSADLRFVKCVN